MNSKERILEALESKEEKETRLGKLRHERDKYWFIPSIGWILGVILDVGLGIMFYRLITLLLSKGDINNQFVTLTIMGTGFLFLFGYQYLGLRVIGDRGFIVMRPLRMTAVGIMRDISYRKFKYDKMINKIEDDLVEDYERRTL